MVIQFGQQWETGTCTSQDAQRGEMENPLVRVAFEPRVLSVQLLRLLLNFMDHKPHGNKESEHHAITRVSKQEPYFMA